MAAELRTKVGDRPCVNGHTVLITDRGGGRVITELRDISEVRWSRLTDKVSTATVTIAGDSCRRQSAKLGGIEPRRHEMVIYRGGDRVWEGPIRYTRLGVDSVKIHAADVLEYLAYRPITKWWPGPDKGGPSAMTDRVEEILEYELLTPYLAPGTALTVPAWEGADPPANVYPHLRIIPGDVLTRSETFPFDMTVLEHLTNLARGGLDFTAVGRSIVVWDSSQPIGRTRVMTESDIHGDPAIYSDGEALVAVQHVTGQPEEGAPPADTGHVGSYVRDLSFYGPWASIHTRSDEDGSSATQQEALNTQARNLSAGKIPVPVDIVIGANASLRLDGTLGINDLVAGVEVPVIARLMGRDVRRTQRLTSITVSETAAGESITASIGNPAVEGGE